MVPFKQTADRLCALKRAFPVIPKASFQFCLELNRVIQTTYELNRDHKISYTFGSGRNLGLYALVSEVPSLLRSQHVGRNSVNIGGSSSK
jgi:hypothetical protein